MVFVAFCGRAAIEGPRLRPANRVSGFSPLSSRAANPASRGMPPVLSLAAHPVPHVLFAVFAGTCLARRWTPVWPRRSSSSMLVDRRAVLRARARLPSQRRHFVRRLSLLPMSSRLSSNFIVSCSFIECFVVVAIAGTTLIRLTCRTLTAHMPLF